MFKLPISFLETAYLQCHTYISEHPVRIMDSVQTISWNRNVNRSKRHYKIPEGPQLEPRPANIASAAGAH